MLAMRAMLEARGHAPEAMEFPLSTFDTYIAPTPAEAHSQFLEPAFTMHRLMSASGRRPPVAATPEAFASHAEALGTRLVTGPAEAASFLLELDAAAGLGHFVAATAQGGLDHQLVLSSMTLFARGVMDVVRAESSRGARG